MIRLWKNDGTSFVNFLSEAESCYVTEEKNGSYYLEMEYPTSGKVFPSIQLGYIITAKPSANQNEQKFRIYKIGKSIDGTSTIYANHISYDMNGIPVKPFSFMTDGTRSLSAVEIFDEAKRNIPLTNAAIKDRFNLDSLQPVTSQYPAYQLSAPSTLRAVLMDDEEDSSLINFCQHNGADRPVVRFDNEDIYIEPSRGEQTPKFTIKYGKNLDSLDNDISIEEKYTAVYPYYGTTSTETKASTISTIPRYDIFNSNLRFTEGWLKSVDGTSEAKFATSFAKVSFLAIRDEVHESGIYDGTMYMAVDIDGFYAGILKKIVYSPASGSNPACYINADIDDLPDSIPREALGDDDPYRKSKQMVSYTPSTATAIDDIVNEMEGDSRYSEYLDELKWCFPICIHNPTVTDAIDYLIIYTGEFQNSDKKYILLKEYDHQSLKWIIDRKQWLIPLTYRELDVNGKPVVDDAGNPIIHETDRGKDFIVRGYFTSADMNSRTAAVLALGNDEVSFKYKDDDDFFNHPEHDPDPQPTGNLIPSLSTLYQIYNTFNDAQEAMIYEDEQHNYYYDNKFIYYKFSADTSKSYYYNRNAINGGWYLGKEISEFNNGIPSKNNFWLINDPFNIGVPTWGEEGIFGYMDGFYHDKKLFIFEKISYTKTENTTSKVIISKSLTYEPGSTDLENKPGGEVWDEYKIKYPLNLEDGNFNQIDGLIYIAKQIVDPDTGEPTYDAAPWENSDQNIYTFDASSELGSSPTKMDLYAAGIRLIENKRIQSIKDSMTISYLMLSKATEYVNKNIIDSVELCDWVTIDYEYLGIKGDYEITSLTWDAIFGEVYEIKIGYLLRDTLPSFVRVGSGVSNLKNDSDFATNGGMSVALNEYSTKSNQNLFEFFNQKINESVENSNTSSEFLEGFINAAGQTAGKAKEDAADAKQDAAEAKQDAADAKHDAALALDIIDYQPIRELFNELITKSGGEYTKDARYLIYIQPDGSIILERTN